MNNEIRNELLYILNMQKSKEEKDKNFYLEMLLERFEYDIKDQLEEEQRKIEKLEDNLKVLDYVKKQLKEIK